MSPAAQRGNKKKNTRKAKPKAAKASKASKPPKARPTVPPPREGGNMNRMPPPHQQDSRREYNRPPSPRRDFNGRIADRYSRNDDMYQFRGNDYRDEYRNRDDYRENRGGRDYRDGRNDRHDGYQPGYSRQRSRSPPRGDSYRPNDAGFRPSNGSHDFNFQYDAPGGINQGMRNTRYEPPSDRRARRGPNLNRQNGRGRGGYGQARRAADRPFLKGNREPTPELMRGMDEDEKARTKFLDINDLSDSEEEDMDMSEDDNTSGADIEGEQPRKKQTRVTSNKAADGDSVPRWSNPDPYTALPPPDETQRKKKDVVKLIRKARVGISEEASKPAAVTDDFISFDFDDDDVNNINESSPIANVGEGVPGAPSGPRYSHKEALHQTLPSLPPKPTFEPAPPQIAEPLQDSALGSRKRTHNDEFKGPPRFVKKPIGKASNGRVVKEWLPKNDPVPWCTFDHSETENMGNWLHREIIDFYEHVKPQRNEDSIRDDLLDHLGAAVNSRWPDAQICPFGSFVAGLYLPTADMDVVFVSDRFMGGGYGKYNTTKHLRDFERFLRAQNLAAPSSIECITKAKVPLVKYVDRITGLRVDVSFENDTGLIANKTFKQWKEKYPAMPILVTLVKQFLTMRGLNEPVNGGIGGFSVICLVTSLLQLMPQVQSGDMIPEHHLGEILMEFLDLYGNEFNTVTTGIQLNPPRYVSKTEIKRMVYKLTEGEPRFSIIDPNDDTNDIAGGAKNTQTILDCFSQAFSDLQKRMKELENLPIAERKNQSILAVILAGDYSSFDQQRDHLRYLHSLKSKA